MPINERYQVRKARLCITDADVAKAISYGGFEVERKKVSEAVRAQQRGTYMPPKFVEIVRRANAYLSKLEKERGIT